ncbi:hypothetical protein HG531_002888 [Fusarium graminearum]|nr:hypothetical protein HG531_002888 [Fusarium graminearum]
MIQQPQEVFALMENKITDHDLPLIKVPGEKKGRHELRRKFQPHRPLECLHKWSPFLIDSFEGCQWMMMSPFFSWEDKRAVRTYYLADQTILPFIEDSSRDVDMEDDEDFQGGHGSIFKVKIHPAHHNFHHIAEAHDSDSAFAVKRLHSRSREMFSREVDALKRLSGQKHIVPLLATFEYKNSYHLLFPWANANLRRYWAMFPNPSIDRRYGLWVAKQCKGMAEGLSIIHEPPPDQNDDYAYEVALQPSHLQSQSSQSYGRHGDIKPENILWFRNGPNTDIGVLEIADFGLTRFHNRRSRSNISPVGMGNSPTYRAPEFDMPDGLLSRSYDIWALGCVYLEFLTWYFMGWKGVTEFSTLREYKRNNLEADDAYFELTGAPETGNICGKVKPEVFNWIALLHQHSACSPFFHDFLDLIKNSTLVVETDGEAPVRRATAAEVKQRLERRLRTRKRTKTEADSNETIRDTQRWYEMYKIIFPDADVQTISPYNDYNNGAYTAVGSSETIADYSKFIDGGIPSEVQNKLQATINRELGCSELDVRRIIDILPMLQQTLLQSFQNQNDN